MPMRFVFVWVIWIWFLWEKSNKIIHMKCDTQIVYCNIPIFRSPWRNMTWANTSLSSLPKVLYLASGVSALLEHVGSEYFKQFTLHDANNIRIMLLIMDFMTFFNLYSLYFWSLTSMVQFETFLLWTYLTQANLLYNNRNSFVTASFILYFGLFWWCKHIETSSPIRKLIEYTTEETQGNNIHFDVSIDDIAHFLSKQIPDK